jgi:uncharacterized protein YunC (DUF1805 family)
MHLDDSRRWGGSSSRTAAAALVLVLAGGCGSHVGPEAATVEGQVRPAAAQAAVEPAPDATIDGKPAADPFWNGLERHEIALNQTLLLVKGSRGIVACPYLNVDSFARTGEACAIVPAVNIDGMVDSRVTAVTPKAQELGIEVGMSGREALDKIR